MQSSRKRKRASSDSVEPRDNDQNGSTSSNAKGLAVWDAFREEYVESVEQLPLSIHRNFALLKEIDVQSSILQQKLPPKITEYIRSRRVTWESESSSVIHEESATEGRSSSSSVICNAAIHGLLTTDDHNLNVDQASAEGQYTHKLLSNISVRLTELLRAAEEKVNLAKATYDSIDKHVRLLDQAIKDHELHSRENLSVAKANSPINGLRKTRLKDSADSPTVARGSKRQNPRPERNLRSFVAGRLRKEQKARTSSTADRSLSDDNNSDSNSQLIEHPEGAAALHKTPSVISQLDPAAANAASADSLLAGDMPINPNEPRYCYCRGFSWGEMVACDAADCEYEWFHLDCAGLKEAPKKNKLWYCNRCKESGAPRMRKRGS